TVDRPGDLEGPPAGPRGRSPVSAQSSRDTPHPRLAPRRRSAARSAAAGSSCDNPIRGEFYPRTGRVDYHGPETQRRATGGADRVDDGEALVGRGQGSGVRGQKVNCVVQQIRTCCGGERGTINR